LDEPPSARPDPGPPAWLGIEGLADRIGGFAWVEARLFEELGRWSVADTDPAAQALWATTSRHCAWHARLWHDHLPDSPALAADGRVREPRAWASFAEAFATAGPDRLQRFVGAIALPLVAGYDELAANLGPVADAATARLIRFVRADHLAALTTARQLAAEHSPSGVDPT